MTTTITATKAASKPDAVKLRDAIADSYARIASLFGEHRGLRGVRARVRY